MKRTKSDGFFPTQTFTVPKNPHVYFYPEPVSMSLGFPGLTEIVKTSMKHSVVDENALFLFLNKRKDYIKVIYFSKAGYCLFAKRLVNGEFRHGDLRREMTLTDLKLFVDHVILNKGHLAKLKKAA